MQEAPDWSSLEFRTVRRWQPYWLDGGSEDLPRRWRLPLFALLVGLHAIALWLFPFGLATDAAATKNELTILVDFIDLQPTVASEQAVAVGPQETQAAARPQAAESAPRKKFPSLQPPGRANARQRPATALLFNDIGRVRLPDGLMDELDKRSGERRQFDFQMPGIGKTHALMEHRSPLLYEATRFDKDWKPDQDLLTELLTKAVEATTKEVRIPMPGNPRATLVCRVSILAMGGGCGIEHAGADYLPPGDDPDTLSPEENRQCQAWWEKIVGATTQEAWLQTRALYDAQCRKPLLREKALPRAEAEAG